MSQQTITGGDGSTGQTGEEVKDIINENFTELYLATSDEFSRAYTETLIFDKKEIFYAPHVQDDDMVFSLATSGHLVNESSGARMTVAFDGIHSISFGPEFNELIGFDNGDIIEAGTRKIYLLYVNGEVSVNIPGASSEQSTVTKLSTPGSFAVVADGETSLDLTWVDVDNEIGYQIEKSLNGSTGWVLYSNPVANATSDTETGLNPGDIVYYRIKALGDGTIYSDSNYAYANGQTENSGDTTPPSFTFDPVNGEDEWTVNRPITITANEPIRNDNGTEITNANVASVITLKETNSGGANISFTATISTDKTIIIITPSTSYGAAQVVYVDVHDVEDMDGNEIASPSSITFTTTSYTYYNGTSNRLQFGDLLDSVWAIADSIFRLNFTIRNHASTSTRVFIGKADFATNQRSWFWASVGTDIFFYFYGLGNGTSVRAIKWAGALASGELQMQLDYNGSLDTNDGLDRCVLTINSVVQGSKTLDVSGDVLSKINALVNSNAYLASGNLINGSGVPGASYWFSGEAKDLKVTTNSGSTEYINIPVIAEGTDVSGGNRHGTWV